MEKIVYNINKGVNRQIEFRGLKAQYIYYLAIGLTLLLIGFSVMYIAGVPVYLCVASVLLSGGGLFSFVFRYSHRYGAFGLMKVMAYRQVPPAIIFRSFLSFYGLLRSRGERNR